MSDPPIPHPPSPIPHPPRDRDFRKNESWWKREENKIINNAYKIQSVFAPLLLFVFLMRNISRFFLWLLRSVGDKRELWSCLDKWNAIKKRPELCAIDVLVNFSSFARKILLLVETEKIVFCPVFPHHLLALLENISDSITTFQKSVSWRECWMLKVFHNISFFSSCPSPSFLHSWFCSVLLVPPYVVSIIKSRPSHLSFSPLLSSPCVSHGRRGRKIGFMKSFFSSNFHS